MLQNWHTDLLAKAEVVPTYYEQKVFHLSTANFTSRIVQDWLEKSSEKLLEQALDGMPPGKLKGIKGESSIKRQQQLNSWSFWQTTMREKGPVVFFK